VTKLVTGNVATDDISNMDGFDQAKKVFASSFDIGGVQVKVTIFWWLFFAAIATWVLLRTKYGNWIFAVGGNKDSARAVGVPVPSRRSPCSCWSASVPGSSACTSCSPSTRCSPVRASGRS